MFVLYKLPTVVISRRTDQYSKAFENLLGLLPQPQQGVPKSRTIALARTDSGIPSVHEVLLLSTIIIIS